MVFNDMEREWLPLLELEGSSACRGDLKGQKRKLT